MPKCQNIADWRVPIFIHDWYERDNINENVI